MREGGRLRVSGASASTENCARTGARINYGCSDELPADRTAGVVAVGSSGRHHITPDRWYGLFSAPRST